MIEIATVTDSIGDQAVVSIAADDSRGANKFFRSIKQTDLTKVNYERASLNSP